MQIGAKLLGDEVGTTPDIDDDAVFTKSRDPSAGNLGVGVFHGDDDPGDAGLDDGVGARRGRPVVRAGFQSAVQGGPTRVVPGCLEGDNFCVTAAAPLGRTAISSGVAAGTTCGNDHGTHPRPGRNRMASRPAECNGLVHVVAVNGGHRKPAPTPRTLRGSDRSARTPRRSGVDTATSYKRETLPPFVAAPTPTPVWRCAAASARHAAHGHALSGRGVDWFR